MESIGMRGDQAVFVTLDETIGKPGEQGEAWRAHCTSLPALQYVVKICRTPSGTAGTSIEAFKLECDALADLDHPNIVRIVNSGTGLTRGSEARAFPFYTMEFLGEDAVTLNQALASHTVSNDRKLTLCLCTLRDAASALKHVHQRGYCHGDIKESNILISGMGAATFKIKLIDFGFSHHLVRQEQTAEPEAAGPEKPSSIRRRGEPKIPDANHDVFQLCYMLKRCIKRCQDGKTNLAAVDKQDYWPIDYAVYPKLMHLLDRWASEDQGSTPETASADEFFDELGKLTRDYDLGPEVREAVRYLSIPEIATAAQICKPFEAMRLPPRQQVLYSEGIKELITTAEFSALRFIRQLGFTHLVYPGAQGTRLEHSVGMYDLACHVVIRMSNRPDFRRICDDQRDILKFIMAALLHDVGHFPFAHQIEEFGEDDFSEEDLYHVQDLLGGHALRGREVIPALSPDLKKLFDFSPEDVEDIVWLALGNNGRRSGDAGLVKPKTESIAFLHSLLDGLIDLDKLDYIERDAHHCGVPYGSFLDVARINESMRVLDHKGKKVLGFAASAVGSLEQVATARHQLYANVYWHRAVRSATVMFKHAFYLFQQLIQQRESLKGLFHNTVADDVLLDRMTQMTADVRRIQGQNAETRQKADAVLALLRAISGNGKRILYKAVLEKDRESEIADKKFGQEQYRSQRAKARKIYGLLEGAGFLAKQECDLGEHNILIDCHTDTFPDFEKIRIVRGAADDHVDLGTVAPSVTELKESFKRQACKIRVFLNPDALKPGYRSKDGRADVRKFIEESVF